MGLFGPSKITPEKLSRKLIVLTRAEFVESICQFAQMEKKDVSSSGMAGLLYALAVLFNRTSHAQETGALTEEQAIKIKSSVSEFYVNSGFKNHATEDQIAAFIKPIYKLQDTLPNLEKLAEDSDALASLADSVCELADLSKERRESVSKCLTDYLGKVDKLLGKYLVV